ncbi:MAG: SOS response-associated peptidase [Bacteroidota bacterium]
MCYDVSAVMQTQLKRARRDGDIHAIRELTQRLARDTDLPLFHTSGFSHPKMLIYTNDSPNMPVVSQWGLVPFWAKDKKDIWNKTLNARGETIFEKNSFKSSAKNKRCLIQIDGFFEHHHHTKETIPYYISRKDNKAITLAGLWNEWTDPNTDEVLNTFAIVTTEGNPMMAIIHNNPKLKGPRMPVILPEELEDKWLHSYDDELVEQAVEGLIEKYPESNMQAHSVSKLRGKNAIGNVPEALEVFEYDDVPVEY